LFATRCIEAGVDIPTVSRWLGHQDGGALCMKTYGHLRDEHSANEAKKVAFQREFSQLLLSGCWIMRYFSREEACGCYR